MTMAIIWQQVDKLMIRLREYGELIVRFLFFCFFLYLRIFIHDLMHMALARWRFLPPDFWPGWVLNIAVLLTGILLVGGVRDFYLKKKLLRDEKKEEPVIDEVKTEVSNNMESEDQSVVQEATSKELRRLLWIVGMIFIYIYMLPRVGYFVATFIFPIAYLIYFKERRIILYVVFPIFAVGMIYLLFTQILISPLPRGIGIFYDFSNLFY